MTRGRQLPVNSKVRRRLFPEDEPEKKQSTWTGQDYLSSIVKTEYIARNFKNEVILKGMKWNFDFENERPMTGPIVWYKKGNMGEWVGMQRTGKTIHMRKRSRDPTSTTKSVYEDERSKVRRLSPHSVMRRRGFFTDGKALENAITEGEDDNYTNAFLDDSPPVYHEGIHWNFDYDNRVPLDGPVIWEQVGEDWVGLRPGLPARIVVNPKPLKIHNTDRKAGENSTGRILSSDNVKEKQDKVTKKRGGYETDEGEEMEKRNKIDEGDKMKKGNEKIIQVNDALNNVVIENDGVATNSLGDENDNKALSMIPDDKLRKLRITENVNTDMEEDFQEKANDMMNKNETTPKNQIEKRTIKKPRSSALNETSKRRLYSL